MHQLPDGLDESIGRILYSKRARSRYGFVKQRSVCMDREPDRYDRIGLTYATTRLPDPRIAARIRAALGDVRTVVNVGAGTGSYEPSELDVTAVEPSDVMIAQRGTKAARVTQASAESLPFDDGAFDAAMAVLTVHHWTDPVRGIAELRRVARKVVIFCGSAAVTNSLWITADYFPSMARLPSTRCST